MTDQTKHPDPERWWRWRRRLAIGAMLMATLETIAGIGAAYARPEALEYAGALMAWSYGLWALIIIAYVAASTLDDAVSRYVGRQA